MLIADQMEIGGMALVLIAVGWEVFLEKRASTTDLDAYFHQLNHKLLHLWIALGDPNPSNHVRQAGDNFNFFDFVGKDRWKVQLLMRVRFAIFAIGSALLIGAKILEKSMAA
jgi:hypothetical protein